MINLIPFGLISKLLPMVIGTIQKIPIAEKRYYAAQLLELCLAYCEGDRLAFTKQLDEMKFDPEFAKMIEAAAWDENQGQ